MIKKPLRQAPSPAASNDCSQINTAGSAPHRLLLIEDDRQIAQLVVSELSDANYSVEWSPNGQAGIEQHRAGNAELVILDLNLPDVDGLEVCTRIRARDRMTPIVMLTARTTKREVVRGLELGADEYITKPFDTLELIARIRALFRRVDRSGSQALAEPLPKPVRCGKLLVDSVRRQAIVDARPLVLTSKEFDLLLLFAKHPGRTFTRDELLSRVWGDGFEGFEHTVNTHINRLRNKVEADVKKPTLIQTVWGVGYRLADLSSA